LMLCPVETSWYMPFILSAWTMHRLFHFRISDFFARSIITTIHSIVAPSDIWTTFVGRATPIIAPIMAQAEAITAMARRALNLPILS